LEAVDPPVELRICKDGLDHPLAFSLEAAAVVGLKDAAHERIRATVPSRPGAFAFERVGRDQHLDPTAQPVSIWAWCQ